MDDGKEKIVKAPEEDAGLADAREREKSLTSAWDVQATSDKIWAKQGGANQPAVDFDIPGAVSAIGAKNLVAGYPSSIIGPYRLLEHIGEGGTGVVYLAEQREPVSRRVALKIINIGMNGSDAVARFNAERQAFTRMEHPNVGGLLDAGTTDAGQPYLVGDYVVGLPIMEVAEQRCLDLNARIELFQQVCDGVEHVHQEGVIHRNIKPSNVLVESIGSKLHVKVIDFGIVPGIEGRLTDDCLLTHTRQIVGAPLFMSPEQIRKGSGDVDARSDIYSLGILLYQLITGEPPFGYENLLKVGEEEVCRIIRYVVPSIPSRKLIQLKESALSEGEIESSLELERTSRKCIGNLDAIVMKALDKDRDKRYETVSEFLEDLSEFLKGGPVRDVPNAFLVSKRSNQYNTLEGC